MARRSKTPSFSCELPLILSGDDERVLSVRLDCARQVYNAVLGESLKRLAQKRQAKAYQAARALPRRTKEEKQARASDVVPSGASQKPQTREPGRARRVATRTPGL